MVRCIFACFLNRCLRVYVNLPENKGKYYLGFSKRTFLNILERMLMLETIFVESVDLE